MNHVNVYSFIYVFMEYDIIVCGIVPFSYDTLFED